MLIVMIIDMMIHVTYMVRERRRRRRRRRKVYSRLTQ
jgi:hypothetical protein